MMSCTSSLLYAVQHPTLLCVTTSLHMLIWCRLLAGCISTVCFMSCVCSYCSSSLFSSSFQDTLDPHKDADATLAVIIGVASAKHRNCEQMNALVQRAFTGGRVRTVTSC